MTHKGMGTKQKGKRRKTTQTKTNFRIVEMKTRHVKKDQQQKQQTRTKEQKSTRRTRKERQHKQTREQAPKQRKWKIAKNINKTPTTTSDTTTKPNETKQIQGTGIL